jgi:hypothetical protein
MTPEKTVEEKLAELARAIGSEDRFVENVMSRIDAEPTCKAERTTKMKNQPIIRRLIMNRFTKFATAAVIIIAVVLVVNLLWNSAPSAYAIGQTIQANHTVRYLHIKDFDAEHSDEPKEFWLEFYEDGQVKNVRMSFPEWSERDDGAKVVVWKESKAQVWFVKKNSLLTVRDEKVAAEMLKLVIATDPRLAVERLYEQQIQGKVKLDIVEPSQKSEPIVITATYATGGLRRVLFVDRATKLVTRMDIYQLKGDEYQYIGRDEYYDYNQPIEAGMFTLDDEVPADVLRVDQTTQEVGLPQGKLGDEEIAAEVVRQFFEALIAGDYAKAGKLLEGMPSDKMQQMFGQIKFLRIITIGPVSPHPIPETKGLVVPCTVEIEKDGQTSQWKLERIGVRQVYNQPGRWTIFGGI